MLQLKGIHKKYKTGELVQIALDSVDLSLRDNEFVAILGPSGSGKTTLLNVIGGLDRYDSGDLIINGISTKKYTDRDWDSYRNHTIGFVFQNYNLIPHQTILANVELALTISGVPAAERRRRAVEALKQVGLGDQLHKHPLQMSGGQMQRVAIARALVNNPEILLADEPTGALDSETSLQVMELLKEVAKDRLVVMVTHNPELAEQYATRIVKLRDGKIISDTQPFTPEESAPPVHKNMGRASMSLLTSLSLSFNNLRTKKARTFLTSFAGSIGIIGIALVISLSTGVNNYIDDMERSTLSEYPLQISSSGINISSLLTSKTTVTDTSSTDSGEDGVVTVREWISRLVSGVSSNDLTSFKSYLESDDCTIKQDVTSIEYSYGVSPQIYRVNDDGSVRKVNPDTTLSTLGISSLASSNELVSSMMDTSVFSQLPENDDLYRSQYDVKAGRWPENSNECVLVLSRIGSISDYALYTLGLRDSAELDKMVQQFAQNQTVDVPTDFSSYSYSDFLGLKFKVVNSADFYVYDETYGVWKSKADDAAFTKQLVANGEDLTIVGIVQPSADASASMLSTGVAYPASLTKHVIEQSAASDIVKAQLADPLTNVLTGESFGSENANGAFDLSSVFSVDADALKNAFQIDENAINIDLSGAFNLNDGQLDLSQMIDLKDITLSIDTLPDIDMSAILEDMDVSISEDQLNELSQKVLDGYRDYVIGNGILHLNKISFSSYMQSDEFKKLLSSSMEEMLGSAGLEEKFAAAMQQAMQTLMDSYSAQVTEALEKQLNAAMQQAMTLLAQNLQETLQQNLSQLSSQMENALKIDTEAFKNAIHVNMTEDDLSELLTSLMLSSEATFQSNMQDFGYADFASPTQISIYPLDFERKATVLEKLDAYNAAMEASGEEEKAIQYTDLAGTLMTSVTEIVNMISNMLIAFVSISLVVSSIMIAVITYISVLERRKEIGILRALGASKRNISSVFNAETFIIGLFSGLIGIILSRILLIPGNMLIRSLSTSTTGPQVTAILTPGVAVMLVLLATVLTILAGLIPSMGAARSNPVAALRAE